MPHPPVTSTVRLPAHDTGNYTGPKYSRGGGGDHRAVGWVVHRGHLAARHALSVHGTELALGLHQRGEAVGTPVVAGP
jgi:hypothetical protein